MAGKKGDEPAKENTAISAAKAKVRERLKKTPSSPGAKAEDGALTPEQEREHFGPQE